MRDDSGDEHVMWTILMEAAVNMYNATLVQRSHFAGEQEYLCTPYSVFTVDSANWQAGTTARPHHKILKASPTT